MWFGKNGITFRVEVKMEGHSHANVPGFYLNSPPRWVDCGIIVAPDREQASKRARARYPQSTIRVYEDQHGEMQ